MGDGGGTLMLAWWTGLVLLLSLPAVLSFVTDSLEGTLLVLGAMVPLWLAVVILPKPEPN